MQAAIHILFGEHLSVQVQAASKAHCLSQSIDDVQLTIADLGDNQMKAVRTQVNGRELSR
jgi:hypothetical protein